MLGDNSELHDGKDEEGNTILMNAAKHNYSEVVKYLLNNGADKTIKNNENKTALDMAKKLIKSISDNQSAEAAAESAEAAAESAESAEAAAEAAARAEARAEAAARAQEILDLLLKDNGGGGKGRRPGRGRRPEENQEAPLINIYY